MRRFLKRLNFTLRRKSALPLILIGGLVIFMLFFNDDISIRDNMKFDRQIRDLRQQVKENQDSAAYYRAKYEAVVNGKEDLERLAREQYHMQRPTEDIFLVNEED